jgi:hypothetical protein
MAQTLSATRIPLGWAPSWRAGRPNVMESSTPQKLTPAEQCSHDWVFWRELLGTMLNAGSMPARAKVLACRAAIAAGDFGELRLLAHALKGSAATMCLSQLTLVRVAPLWTCAARCGKSAPGSGYRILAAGRRPPQRDTHNCSARAPRAALLGAATLRAAGGGAKGRAVTPPEQPPKT